MYVTAGKIGATGRMLGFVAALLILFLMASTASAMDMGKPEKEMKNTGPFGPIPSKPPCLKMEPKDFKKIKERYMRDKARLKSHHFGIVINEDTFDEAKEWLLSGDDLAVASLLSIKEKIENSSSYPEKEVLLEEIDGHIADISAVREKIESATTVEELKNAAKELRKEWIEAKISLKKAIGLRWIYVMERMLDRSEKVAERVQNLINEYKAQGKDVTMLERWLEKFTTDTERAKERLEKAKERLMELERNRQVNRFLFMEDIALKKSMRYMHHSYLQLKRIIWYINHQQSGEVDIEGSGILFAAGNGSVTIEGSGVVKICGNGTVTAPENNVVVAIGFGEKQVNNGTVTYKGEGKIIVRGENITVTANGELRVFAKGNGSVHLEGTGVYKTKGFVVSSSGFEEQKMTQGLQKEVEEEIAG